MQELHMKNIAVNTTVHDRSDFDLCNILKCIYLVTLATNCRVVTQREQNVHKVYIYSYTDSYRYISQYIIRRMENRYFG